MSAEPTVRAVEHAFSELRKLYADPGSQPPRHPASGTKRGVDFYGVFELIPAIAHAAETFRRMHRHWPSLDQPRSFSEHIFRYKYLGEFPMPSLGDKLAARALVEKRLSADLLAPLYWCGEDLRAAATLELPPGAYYLKANHGSGLNHRLRSPGALLEDFEHLAKKTREWLSWEWGRGQGEWQYSCFRRMLFIEGFITFAGQSDTPHDYKFYCFNGKVRLIHVDSARFSGHRRSLYTPQWQPLPVRLSHPTFDAPRPACLAQMIAMAETLSAGLRFVRVDLYCDGISAIRFGELTLTPGNAVEPFSDPDFDLALGRCFDADADTRDPIGAWLAKR